MRKDQHTVLTLDETDVDRFESGQEIDVRLENGNDLMIRLSDTARQQLFRDDADPSRIPHDLSQLHYHRELIPLASDFDVIRREGTREREVVERALRNIRDGR